MDTRVNPVRERLERVRQALAAHGAQALLVPSADPHLLYGDYSTSDNTDTGAGGTTTNSTSSTVNASQLLTSSSVDFWSEVREVVAMMIGSRITATQTQRKKP